MADNSGVTKYRIETEQEVDGRWIADLRIFANDRPAGAVLTYGPSEREAILAAFNCVSGFHGFHG